VLPERLRGRSDDLVSERLKPLAYLGFRERLECCGVQLVGEWLRKTGRREQRVPSIGLEAWEPRFRDRRDGGSAANLAAVATPIGRIVLASICGSTDGASPKKSATRPAIRSVSAGAEPR
jgi:hypothetical protein